ncbi:uncharacterized protein LOC128245583 isoform X2 [Mya arenaria]|uniref:uncharacterized protein LOC128245583 isoform X2 n=1 Tax=Mya arenaria TaxID=6604 RepID=UPI0022E43EEF|nr:uncharacterized protein LOC128245583 isoform X2 [Mya arenaria]
MCFHNNVLLKRKYVHTRCKLGKMTSNIDDSLREQSKLLLRKLKDKQTKLQDIVNTSLSEDQSFTEPKSLSITYLKKQPGQDPVKRTPVRRLGSAEKKNVKEKLDTSLEKSVLDRSGREGRARLHKKRSKSKENRPQSAGKSPKRAVSGENKENYYKNSPEKTVPEKVIDIDKVKKNGARSKETNTELEDLRREIEEQCGAAGGERKGNRQQAAGPTTPNTVRKRRIIDQNVKVSGVADLNASELLQECEADFTRLNYSYSGIDDNDLQFLSKRLNAENEQPEEDAPVRDTDTDTNPPARYSQNLSHPGNSRKIASFIKESKKPKSILLANNNSRLNKSGSSRVSFRSPTRDSSGHLSYSMDAYSKQQHKMLGYDWIAALMDNDPAGVNQSETFFDELKEFRKLNLEECVNKVYMDGPQELWEHPEREPSPVQRALEETKVKPYVVNDRLFAEPVHRSLFADYDYQEPQTSQESDTKPTYDEPRFVRVSVPRSTLKTPSRMKPHRRNSFDAADSMALSKHCMMGFNTSKPAMVPASSNIALRDATSGIKSAVRTTLDDAETLAANFPYEWDPKEQSICRPLPRPTYKPESSYADSSWPAAMKSQSLASCLHTSSNFQQTSQNLQKATDELLDSTYSLMYEMKRLKTERSDHPIKL